MRINEDGWLSAIFEHPVYRIDVERRDASDETKMLEGCASISRHAARQGDATYYTRVYTSEVDLARRMSAAGLYVVDVNVTFALSSDSPITPARSTKAVIAEVRPEQYQEMLGVASSCFQYSRFHLDPLIPDAIANKIKHDWILNYIRQMRGEKVLAAALDGRAVGFLAVLASESEGKRLTVIDLIGVDRAFQNQGIGHAMVAFFIREYKHRCDVFQVGTQAANIPSMRLYGKFGFAVIKTQYVMHMHVRGGRCLPQ